VAVNCSAIPDTLLEGELFGYKKGAFTDARNDKKGLFEEADGGTLFLDEIGDMPLAVQPKILRAIQEKEIRPLGGLESVRVDVRIIAATNQNLEELMEKKLFRPDLFYRLNAFQLELPSLASRREDIPLLAEHFLGRFQKIHGHQVREFSPQAMKLLLNYPWPGNVRELENSLHRAVLLSAGPGIGIEAIVLGGSRPASATAAGSGSGATLVGRTVDDVERELIIDTLTHCLGNRTHAANILGISIRTLRNKLKLYNEEGFTVPHPREGERPAV
jgi:DNA-binding NtrC family response regulator